MTPQDFSFLRDMLKDRSGLVLTEDKRYLVESRLEPVAKKNGFESLSALVVALNKMNSENLRSEVTEAMTINESFFFRDKVPFTNFEEVMMPHMLAERTTQRRVRIWCAAASTGQEPYSLSMLLKEMADKLVGWRTEIIGTDLSAEVLEKAKAGLYSQFEVQRGLPIQLLVKYFKQTGSVWQIDSSVRAMVQLRTFNLLDDYRSLGNFDIVFCRNVLIYFDQETKASILERIAKQMAPDGFLVLGAAETMVGLTDAFSPVSGRRGLYQVAGGKVSSADKSGGSIGTAATGTFGRDGSV